MSFNYYYGTEADQFTFIRIPKLILTGKQFSGLSIQAKMLYGLLLDRMSLSMKNGWLDDENRVFIIYQIAEIQEDLGFSKKKAIDYLAELEGLGLIEKKRRGLGLSNIIYVKSFMSGTSRGVEIDTSESVKKLEEEDIVAGESAVVTTENTVFEGEKGEKIRIFKEKCARSVDLGTSRSVEMGTSRGSEIVLQEVLKQELPEVPEETPLKSNNNINNIYSMDNQSNRIFSGGECAQTMRLDDDEILGYSAIIKANIDLDGLIERYPQEQLLITGIYDLILEMVLGKGERVLIASNWYPAELVKSKFLKLNSMHVEYVLECFRSNTTKVKNIKKYLLAALLNAPSTMEGHYLAAVNHDFPQYVVRE